MQILNKPFKYINWLRRVSPQYDQCHRIQSRLFSTPVPVKLAFNVYNQSGTDESATPVVILHGLFGSKQNWRTAGKGLNLKTKRKIYVADLRNHGDSPHDDNHSAGHICEDLRLLVQNENLRRVALIGHSMGGKAMMYFSQKYPELVEKAIVVDISPVSIPEDFSETKQVIEAMLKLKIPSSAPLDEGRAMAEETLKSLIGSRQIIDFIMYNLRKTPSGEFVWRFNLESLLKNFDNIGDTRRLDFPPFRGPVLFIGGKKSAFINPNDWPKIKEIFPNAELKWLETHHLIHIEQPQQFLELVVSFLNK